MTLDDAIRGLRQSRKNTCCSDLTKLLTELGFVVRDGNQGGHKVFTHPHLPSFFSGSFNCGHGKDPEIKPPYISKIIKTLQMHETDLNQYLSKR